MNKTILNQEHVEARQAEVNRLNSLLKERLSEEDRAKVETVESIVKDFEDKGIGIYLYAWLPSLASPEKNVMIQYNNMATVVGFDEKGRFKDDIGKINDSLIGSMWNTFSQAHDGDFAKWCAIQYEAILREQSRLGFDTNSKDKDV